jgi:hypothetical protein
MDSERNEFWWPKRLNLDFFLEAFLTHFPSGQLRLVSKNNDHRPGYQLLELEVPVNQKTSLIPFCRTFAEIHHMEISQQSY